jgi:Putative translation initiation inhibitor, yjgF family
MFPTTDSRLKVKHSNPEGLFDSRVFSQVVTVSGNAKTIYIGGQNAINSEGQLIGQDNLELQTKQVLENINLNIKLLQQTLHMRTFV